MISQTAEYALRAVTHLAQQDGQPCTTRDIAGATQVPMGYLAKVLKELSRAGMVTSQRGLHGGFRLVGKPESLSVIKIIEVVAPLPRIRECPLGLEQHRGALCPLHKMIDNAMADAEAAFANTTIGDLVEYAGDGSVLCERASRKRRGRS